MIPRTIRYILSFFITYFKYIILIIKYKNTRRLYYELDEETLIDIIRKTRLRISIRDNSLLILSIKNNQYLLSKFLLNNKRLKIFNLKSIIAISVNYNNLYGLQLLLEDGRFDPSYSESEALRAACDSGKIEMVKLLLSDGRSDPTARQQLAIRWATLNKHTEIVRMLMKYPDVDPTYNNLSYNSAFYYASSRGYIEILKIFLKDHRVNPAVNDNRLMYVACRDGYIDVIKLVMNHPSINLAIDNNRFLFTAVNHDYVNIGKLLITKREVLKQLTIKDIKYLYLKGILPSYNPREICR